MKLKTDWDLSYDWALVSVCVRKQFKLITNLWIFHCNIYAVKINKTIVQLDKSSFRYHNIESGDIAGYLKIKLIGRLLSRTNVLQTNFTVQMSKYFESYINW